MRVASTVDILNDLIVMLGSSLPSYLADASPWVPAGGERSLATLRDVAEQQRAAVDRLSVLVTDENGIPESGEFPLSFTRFNDLSLDYLVRESLRRQEHIVDALEAASLRLAFTPDAKKVVEEVLGEAKAHLDMLRDSLEAVPS